MGVFLTKHHWCARFFRPGVGGSAAMIDVAKLANAGDTTDKYAYTD